MFLANAYPSDALSPLMMAAIIGAVAAGLGAWLILVFVADQSTSAKGSRPAHIPTPVPAGPDRAAEDEHSEAGHAPLGARHGAAA